MLLLVKIVFSTIEFAAMVLVCLSLFRIYFRYSFHKVACIAFIMSIISVYTRDIIHEPLFSALSVLLAQIILITILFALPLIFSLLVCIIGSLATVLGEGLVISLGSKLFNLFSEEALSESMLQFIALDLSVTALLLLLVYPLQKYKLGFHTTNNDALKGYNFLLSAILVIAVFATQIQVMAVKDSSVNLLIPIFIGVIFLLGIYLAYKHNKKLWKDRRERLSKR